MYFKTRQIMEAFRLVLANAKHVLAANCTAISGWVAFWAFGIETIQMCPRVEFEYNFVSMIAPPWASISWMITLILIH